MRQNKTGIEYEYNLTVLHLWYEYLEYKVTAVLTVLTENFMILLS